LVTLKEYLHAFSKILKKFKIVWWVIVWFELEESI
jgi:hypothetical protein